MGHLRQYDSWAAQMMTAQISPFQICPKFVQKNTPGKAYDSVGIGRHGNFTKYLMRID